ncbi:hypothetical protein DFQ26_007749 [Actinomortierella ambigua]|nr:hypothetical protein DFQ26_007749 [Actinomortierella ambigua]
MSLPRMLLKAGSRRGFAMPLRRFSAMPVARSAAAEAEAAPKLTYKAPATGVNRTYDEALKIIAEDKIKRLEEIKVLQAKIGQLKQAAASQERDAEIEALEDRVYKQQVYAELNDPEVQWRFQHGVEVDMSKPVFRYMKNKQFVRERLPVIQQRVTQMFVTPDLLPPFTPSMDVRLDYDLLGSSQITASKSSSLLARVPMTAEQLEEGKYFETGSYLLPGQTLQQPKLDVGVFHPEQRLYTIVMVDPDVPDMDNQAYKQKLHWVMTNVPLSATQTLVDPSTANVILPYLPPHPHKGTKYHRYTVLVCEQPNKGQESISSEAVNISRDSTTFQSLCSQLRLSTKGLTFFRQIWDKDVSKIYKEILQEDEPVFGKMPRVDPLLDEAGQKKKKYENL